MQQVLGLIRAQSRSLIFVLALASYFFSTTSPAGVIDEYHVSKAKALCKEKGTLLSKGPVEVDGYLRANDVSDSFSFDEIAKELVSKQYRFLEMPQEYFFQPRTGKMVQSGGFDPIRNYAAGSGKKYFRFYLAKKDSPACAGFQEELKRYPSQTLPFLRQLGLPTDLCIASEKTDELKSRYEMLVERYHSDLPPNHFTWWSRFIIRDRSSSGTLAEVTASGYDPGFKGHGFTCPNGEQIQRFFNEALVPTLNSLLPKKNEVRVIDNPPEFQTIQDSSAELVEEINVDKPITQREISGAVNPIAKDGSISFTHKYKTYLGDRGGGGFTLDGYYLHIVLPEITKKILVRAAEKNYWDFQKLSVVNGKITFSAEEIHSAVNSTLAILEYTELGEPIRITRIKFPQIRTSSNIRLLIDNIETTPDRYLLTVLDIDRQGPGFIVRRAFKFRVQTESKGARQDAPPGAQYPRWTTGD